MKKWIVIIGSIIVAAAVTLVLIFKLGLFNNAGGESSSEDLNSSSESISEEIIKEKIEITQVDILYDGSVINQHEIPMYTPMVEFGLKINEEDAELLTNNSRLDVEVSWSFVGGDYGIDVVENPSSVFLNKIGYVIGEIYLRVEVVSENTITAMIPIKIVPGEDFTFDSIVVFACAEGSNNYIEGQVFEKDSVIVWGKKAEKEDVRILEFEYSKEPLKASGMETEIAYRGCVFEYPIFVADKTLQSLEIINSPDVVEYLAGQCFDKTGLVVQANYEYFSEIIEDFEVDTTTMLLEGTNSIQIRYTYKDTTKTAAQPITVIPRKLLALIVEDANVQKEYTQGNTFDTDGLIVKAEFESFGILEIKDYTYTDKPLELSDKEVEIRYSVADVTLKKQIAISVKKPYENLSTLTILTPADVQISWAYSYQAMDGTMRLDNTAYEENGLVYDKINGEYEIPVGAIVTAAVRNPSIIDLAINGEAQKMDLEEKLFSWKVKSSAPITMSTIQMSANHAVVRFTGDKNEKSFLYEGYWNGLVSAEDIGQLSTVFADTDSYYYTYLINGKSLRIDELKNTVFVKNAVIAVAKNVKSEDAKNVILNIGSDIRYTIRIPNAEAELWELPVLTQPGYKYDGWALTVGGERLSDEELIALFASEQEEINLYIRWIEEIVDYSNYYIRQSDGETVLKAVEGEPQDGDILFTGAWLTELSDETQNLQCFVKFNANGTFEYKVVYNGEISCSYQGKYRLDGNSIVVIYSEPTLNVPYLNGADFGFALFEGTLKANAVLVFGQDIVLGDCELEKV